MLPRRCLAYALVRHCGRDPSLMARKMQLGVKAVGYGSQRETLKPFRFRPLQLQLLAATACRSSAIVALLRRSTATKRCGMQYMDGQSR